jgi:hypothetical protein
MELERENEISEGVRMREMAVFQMLFRHAMENLFAADSWKNSSPVVAYLQCQIRELRHRLEFVDLFPHEYSVKYRLAKENLPELRRLLETGIEIYTLELEILEMFAELEPKIRFDDACRQIAKNCRFE